MLAESFVSLTIGHITWQTVPQARSCRTEGSVTDGRKACSQHFQLEWARWPQPLSADTVSYWRPASDVKMMQMLMDVTESSQFEMNKLYIQPEKKSLKTVWTMDYIC